MRKTALNLVKYTSIPLLAATIFFGSLNFIKDSPKLSPDAQAANLSLGLAPSLDIDVAPDGGAYTPKSHNFVVRGGVVQPTNYSYLSDSGARAATPGTAQIEFGRSIGQVANTYVAGKDPQSSRIDANVGVTEGIDWHMGNPRLYREAMQNAKRVYRCNPAEFPGDPNPCPIELQYEKVPYGANQRGFFYVSSNTSEDCYNVAERQNFRIATTHNRFKALSPGTASAPNTDNMPIYYRFGRGVVKSVFSADGNVAMIVESRVYFDNVCTFASMSASEAETDMPFQNLSNVSFPVIALVTYNRRAADGQKWKTVNISQKTYKTAIIPNNGSYDAIIWGASVTGTLAESITFGHPAGGKGYARLDSANPDQAYYRNSFPMFNNGGAGTAAYVSMIGVTNIFGTSPGLVGKAFQVIRDCGGSNCSYDAAPVMSTKEPVFKADNPTSTYSNGTLYITLHKPLFDDNGAYGKSYIIALRGAGDLNKNLNELNYRQFDSVADPRGNCFNFSNTAFDTSAVHPTCIDDVADSLGVTPPSKVPLLQRGNFLRFTGPQTYPDAAGTAASGFFEDPANRSISNSEIQDLPIKRLNSSLMAGSYFIDQGVEKNIIAVADNSTKLVWVGGENLEVKPKLKAFNDPVCDPTDRMNPYKMKFSIQTESGTNANIAYNYAVLTPALASPPTPPVTFTFNSSTNQITSSTNSNYVAAATSGNTTTAQYTSTISPFSPSIQPVFTFTVEFKDRNFYKNFYNTGGFDLYLYIKDANNPAQTNLVSTNQLERVFTNKVFDSFESCGYPFFSTSKGDFRSKESRGTSSLKANKYWQKNSNTPTDSYIAKVNNSDPTLPATSDFGFEWHNTGSTACESRVKKVQTTNNDFCLQVENTYDLTQKGTNGIITKFLNETLEESKQKQLLNVVTVNGASTSPLVTSVNVGGVISDQINLNAISDKNKPTLIEITAPKYSTGDFTIVDSIDPALTPNLIIVKCAVVDCLLRVNSIAALSGADSVVEDTSISPSRIKYGYSSIDDLVEAKSRLYINYSFNTTNYDPKDTYPASSPEPDVRTVVLKVGDTTNNSNKNNFYLGGIISSGYVLSDISDKTNVIKGLVISRGVIARATAQGTKNLYFKEFGLPFIYIDYDAKLMLKFRTIFSQPPSDVVREYVGL
jgi:hypothetical protein